MNDQKELNEQKELIGHTAEELEELSKDKEENRTRKGVGRRYKAKVNRQQADMVGFCLDDRVAANSVVRAIDIYVETLDLYALGFTNAGREKTAGQPSYDPASMFKAYLYGYQYHVRSSRRLERECCTNIELMWLMEEQTPKYRTISSFRSENSKAIQRAHEEFIQLCNSLLLIEGKRVSIDGSHFKGNVSAKSFITKKGLKKQCESAKAEAEMWYQLLEELEASEPENETVDVEKLAELEQKITEAKEKEGSAKQQLEELEAAGKTQHSRTDPDARKLSKGSKSMQGYNVQIATDHKNLLIVGDAVTSDPNDLHQLHPISLIVKAHLCVEKIEVVADKGYYSGKALYDCITDGITPYVAIPSTRTLKQGNKRFKRNEFTYNEQQDGYECPAGSLLKPVGIPVRVEGQQSKQRYRNKAACSHCERQQECLTEKGTYRDIWRGEHETLTVEHAERMEKNPEIYAERSAAVEHPFGTIKNRAGWSHFLVRGKEKVEGEWSLMALCYNFTRVLNILGMDEFKRICRQLIDAKSRSSGNYLRVFTSANVSRFKALKTKRPYLPIKIQQPTMAVSNLHKSITCQNKAA